MGEIMVKDKNKIGVFEWIFNYKKYSDDYITLSRTLESTIKEFENKKETVDKKLKQAEQDYMQKETKLNLKIKNIQEELTKKANRELVLDKAVAERNKQIEELHYEMSKVVLKLDKKEKSFNKLRGSVGGYQKEINKLKKELKKSKDRIDFLKKNVPMKIVEAFEVIDCLNFKDTSKGKIDKQLKRIEEDL